MAIQDTSAYSITYYVNELPGGVADSVAYSMTYSVNALPGGAVDSPPYSITYGGTYEPIGTVGTDSIGQHCAVMKALGNDAGGDMHFVVRTSGPFGVSDGAYIRSVTTVVGDNAFLSSVANMSRQSVLVTGLLAGTNYYWGAAFDTGAESTPGQFTTKQSPAAEQGLTLEGVQP
jgi:hypothetical protein